MCVCMGARFGAIVSRRAPPLAGRPDFLLLLLLLLLLHSCAPQRTSKKVEYEYSTSAPQLGRKPWSPFFTRPCAGV